MNEENVMICPSLYNADLFHLKEIITCLEMANISHLHIDVMDSHFVPSLGFGSNFVADLKKHTALFLDCHLMVEKPEDRIINFIQSGADMITFHAEATKHHLVIINQLRKFNIKVGIAINPGTAVESIKELLPLVDSVLVMTVNPGRSGEIFMPHSLAKISALYRLKAEFNYSFDIQVDGNITDKTVFECVKRGANRIVSGGYIFSNENIQNNILSLVSAINRNR